MFAAQQQTSTLGPQKNGYFYVKFSAESDEFDWLHKTILRLSCLFQIN